MRYLTAMFLILLLVGCATRQEPDQLFTYDDRAFQRDDLPAAMSQKLFNAEVAYYQEAMEIIRQSVIDLYLQDKAKESGKSVSALKAEIFQNKEPTEEEKKKFYEEVKEKLPYSYDIIQHELGSLIAEKRTKEQETKLIKEIEDNKGVRVYVEAPQPPTADVTVKGYPRYGAKDAKVQLVEFGDFSCPNCRLAVDAVDRIMKQYEGQVEFIWRYYFIHSGGASVRLAKGGHCAQQQDKFWPYYRYVFKNQDQLRWKSPTNFVDQIEGIELESFKACFESAAAEDFVNKSHEDGESLGVNQTPTFLVNGKRIVFGSGFQGLDEAIKEAL